MRCTAEARYIPRVQLQERLEEVHGAMRKETTFSNARGIGSALVLLCSMAIVACGSSGNPSVTSTIGAKKDAAKNARKAGPVDPTADMVSAVSTTKAGPAVQLKFAIAQRPEVGQAVDVQVAVIPGVPVPDSVSAAFQSTDGLEVVDGAQLVSGGKPAEGAPIQHVVRILPKRDGIFALPATVSLVSGDQTVTRGFSIPVISGEGMREQVPKSP